MTRCVVDANVAVKWALDEEHSEAAERLLGKGLELWVPDLIWSEIGNIVWKRWRSGNITLGDAQEIFQIFRDAAVYTYSAEDLMDIAWGIAREFQRSFYDSVYVALAIEQDTLLVTADRRLYDALRPGYLGKRLLWVADIP